MANCYIALTLAEAMGEVPLIVMQNIHVVSGKAGFAAQYMIARANASGVFQDCIDWEITGEGKTLKATAFATLSATGRRVSVSVGMDMAEAEGWTKNQKYRTMPEVMLRYRSAAFLVRFYAPQVMLGYRTIEEVEDVVATGMAAAEPLTGAALISQAEPETPEAGEVDETPVEAVDSDPETPTETSEHEQRGETNNTPDDHPARQIAAGIVSKAKRALTTEKLDALLADNAGDIEAMPDDVRGELDGEIAAVRARLGGQA